MWEAPFPTGPIRVFSGWMGTPDNRPDSHDPLFLHGTFPRNWRNHWALTADSADLITE
jgi:hypothetical protein